MALYHNQHSAPGKTMPKLPKEEEKSCNFPQGISKKDCLFVYTAGMSDSVLIFSGCSKRWILFLLHPSTSNFLKSFPKLTWHPIGVMFSALLICVIESSIMLQGEFARRRIMRADKTVQAKSDYYRQLKNNNSCYWWDVVSFSGLKVVHNHKMWKGTVMGRIRVRV